MKTSIGVARALLLALLITPLPGLAGGRFDPQEADPRCGLLGAGGSASSTADCLACHAEGAHGAHPVEIDYAQAQAARRVGRRASALRPLEEVARRGVRLVDGKVTCLTCHDAASRTASHLALPEPLPELRTASLGLREPGRLASPGRRAGGQDPTALCAACHLMGPR